MKTPAEIPDEKLTTALWDAGQRKANWEREFIVKENQRLVVLAVLTEQSTESSHSAAERQARTTTEYKEFLTELGEIKEKLTLSRAWYESIKFEINMRINRSFQDRAEYQGGRLQT